MTPDELRDRRAVALTPDELREHLKTSPQWYTFTRTDGALKIYEWDGSEAAVSGGRSFEMCFIPLHEPGRRPIMFYVEVYPDDTPVQRLPAWALIPYPAMVALRMIGGVTA